MEHSGSLAARFVAAAITYSTAHVRPEVLAWSRVFVCCKRMWPPPIKLRESPLYHGCVCWVSHQRREYSVKTALAAAVSQERRLMAAVSARSEGVCGYVVLRYGYCYGCRASQKRINMSASHGVSRLLPAFWPQRVPCLPCVQRTVPAVWTARQLALWTGQRAKHRERRRWALLPPKRAQKMIWTCQKTQKLCWRGCTDQIRDDLSIKIISWISWIKFKNMCPYCFFKNKWTHYW